MFEQAVFAAGDPKVMASHWRKRIDAAKNDAELFKMGDLLVQGGNTAWLVDLAREELQSEAPFFRRRGVVLWAVAAPDDEAFRAVVAALLEHFRGLADVVNVARKQREARQQMRHWLQEGLRAVDGIEVYRAYRLILQCADRRLWFMVAAARRDAGYFQSALLKVLTRDAIANAIKDNKEDGRKTLLGIPVQEHDAAPWIALNS